MTEVSDSRGGGTAAGAVVHVLIFGDLQIFGRFSTVVLSLRVVGREGLLWRLFLRRLFLWRLFLLRPFLLRFLNLRWQGYVLEVDFFQG
jgi:hypothetical protein